MLALEGNRDGRAPVLTVTAFARQARILVEERFGFVQVEGELSNFRRPGSGHWYFTLKDDNAQVRCAMFAGRNRRVSATPRDGQQVLVRGRASIYEARGDFQLIVDQLEPAGEGRLRAEFEALQKKLAAEGLFADARKRPLPELPRRLCIISSASGAALKDVLHVVERRFPCLEVTLIPTLVQGEGAQAQLLDALARAADLDTDVVLLTRGGGSLEDLWAFNLEAVARAVASCPHPVVSAIGHQTDFTIADFVADVRAPTPSAGAELITPERDELNEALRIGLSRLARGADQELRYLKQTLALARSRLQDPRQRLAQQMQRADELDARLQRVVAAQLARGRAELSHATTAFSLLHPGRLVPVFRQRLHSAFRRLKRGASASVGQRSLALDARARTLQAVSPLNSLGRGYAILQKSDTTERPVAVTSVAGVNPGDALTAHLADGALEVTVDAVSPGRQLFSAESD